jgi:hypothetical protein
VFFLLVDYLFVVVEVVLMGAVQCLELLLEEVNLLVCTR